jgi:hypothetical protein
MAAKAPDKLDALTSAPYNPREITARGAAGLRRSLVEFGDISGITYNFRTGNLIAGHARRSVIAELDPGAIKWAKWYDTDLGRECWGEVAVAGGSRFKVRGVEWGATKEKAANVAANSPGLGGFFTDGLQTILDELQQEDGDLFEGLHLNDLLVEMEDLGLDDDGDDEFPDADPDDIGDSLEHMCPKCGFQFS